MKSLWTVSILITLTGCPAAPLPTPNSPQTTTAQSLDPPHRTAQPVDREQQILEWTGAAESKNNVGAAVWQRGTWNWQFAATDKATGDRADAHGLRLNARADLRGCPLVHDHRGPSLPAA